MEKFSIKYKIHSTYFVLKMCRQKIILWKMCRQRKKVENHCVRQWTYLKKYILKLLKNVEA
jgi:hypothetical protein